MRAAQAGGGAGLKFTYNYYSEKNIEACDTLRMMPVASLDTDGLGPAPAVCGETPLRGLQAHSRPCGWVVDLSKPVIDSQRGTNPQPPGPCGMMIGPDVTEGELE